MSSKWMFWKKRRYNLAVLVFLGFYNISSFRLYQLTALLPMLLSHEVPGDYETVNYLFKTFFYGTISTYLFGGWLSAKIGGKAVFGGGITALTILIFLTPWVIRIGVPFLFVLQILEGIFQGLTYASIFMLWSNWAPQWERTKLATISSAGIPIGILVSAPLSIYSVETFGPEITFYACGGNALVWCIIWWWVVTDSPADDRRISKEELEYIQKSTGTYDCKRRRTVTHPWIKIFTSRPVWALIIANFASGCGFHLLLFLLPMVMIDAFHVRFSANDFRSFVPYLVMGILTLVSGFFADWMREKKILTTIRVRKLFTCCALLAQAGFILLISFSTTARTIMIFIAFAAGMGICSFAGSGVNALDLAPQHASVIMGISQTFAALPKMFHYDTLLWIVTSPYGQNMRIFFWSVSVLLVVASVVYGMCASGEIQPWSVDREEQTAEAEQTELNSLE